MKFFPILSAFLVTDHKSHHVGSFGPLKMVSKGYGTGLGKDCKVFEVRRRLIERYVNGERYYGLDHPKVQPGDVVKQKSLLLNPETREEMGSVHTIATILDPEVRLAHGAYNITKGDRIGVINFQALIPNELATEQFDMAITSGTGQFHSAQGWIITGVPFEYDGALEREATFNICGLYA